MNARKTPLGGRPISRKEAFKGLGNPKTWQKFSDAVYAEFRAKPKSRANLQKNISTALSKKANVFRKKLQPRPESRTAYASSGSKRTTLKAEKTKTGTSKNRRDKKERRRQR